MTRLEKYLGDESVQNYSDVCRLRNAIPELYMCSGEKIEEMYRDYCDTYSAGWLVVDAQGIEEFAGWLRAEVGR